MREEQYVSVCVECARDDHLPQEEGNNDGKVGEVESNIRSIMLLNKYKLKFLLGNEAIS